MRLPTQVLVGGRQVKVEYVPTLEGGSFGEVRPVLGVVHIAMDLHSTEEEVFSTLFHELTHYALWLTGHSEGMTTKQEEVLVSALENMLAGLYTFKKSAPVKYQG